MASRSKKKRPVFLTVNLCGGRLALLLAMAMLLSACGFYLQKPFTAPADSQPVLVSGDLQLARQLRRELLKNNVQVTRKRSQASSIIALTHVHESSREYSLTADGRKAETQRLLSATAEWRYTRKANSASTANGGSVLVSARNMTVEAIQINNPDNQAANQREADLVKTELVELMATRILENLRLVNR